MHGFLVRTLITALGLWIAAAIVPPMEFTSGWTLLGAALLLGIVNALVRPVIIFLTLPITILSLGVFLLVINAAMLGLVAAMLDGFVLGGFFSAIFASIIVSLTSWFASSFIGPRGRIEVIYRHRHHD
ncbi:MAG: phage holin family protein [Candidatus Latescibacterota bacterium]|nr:MAG: phage holin family protein [Candidatus Latescibacterota bacterium]